MGATLPDGTEKSPKSYGVAVSLCGIFGVVGIHHFYLGNWLHGLFDFGLFCLFIGLYAADLMLPALFVLMVDALHTVVVFYKLIVGEQRDRSGRLVTFK